MLEKELADHASALLASPAAPASELSDACTRLAHFHGELVLLEHWCSLNYAGLVKILKKHDKRSSLSLRAPILNSVLRQPFYSTEILSELVRSTEARFHLISQRLKEAGEALEPPPLLALEALPEEGEGAEPTGEEASMLARTRAALSCWQELRKSESIGGVGERRGAEGEPSGERAAKAARPGPPTPEVTAAA